MTILILNNKNYPVDNNISKTNIFSFVEVVRLDIIISKKNIINNNNKYISYHNEKKSLKLGYNIEDFY